MKRTISKIRKEIIGPSESKYQVGNQFISMEQIDVADVLYRSNNKIELVLHSFDNKILVHFRAEI